MWSSSRSLSPVLRGENQAGGRTSTKNKNAVVHPRRLGEMTQGDL